jgi:hypothetical protein
MCDFKTIINSLGLVLTIIGVYVLYINSPLNISEIDGGDASTDFNAIKLQTQRANHLMKIGVYTVLAGTVLQLVSNFIPPRL